LKCTVKLLEAFFKPFHLSVLKQIILFDVLPYNLITIYQYHVMEAVYLASFSFVISSGKSDLPCPHSASELYVSRWKSIMKLFVM